MVKRRLALLLTASMLAGTLTGTVNVAASEGEAKLSDLYDTVSDSSELPDWEGDTLKLTYWYGHGMGDTIREKAENDVYWPEIKRIFGIEFDSENSFDNGGLDLESKMAMLASTNDWPSVGDSVLKPSTEDLITEDIIYDLTELIPEYAPHYWDMINKASPNRVKKGWNNTGKLYGLGYFDEKDLPTLQRLYPDMDLDKYSYIARQEEATIPLYVRDDILKLAYPEAKTQDEIEAMYVEKGEFTREEVYDVKLTTKEEVYDFFYNIDKVIKENNITEGGRPVSTTWVSMGGDNWPTHGLFTPALDGVYNSKSGYYFANYNQQTGHIETTFSQDWFKDMLYKFNMMVRDGVASEESLIDNNEIFMNKLNNGEYAISFFWLVPDEAKLKAAGKDYRYRKVYVDIPQDTTHYVNPATEGECFNKFVIFKDSVKEEDVPRILQMLDFMCSDVGQKLQVWGPKTAGLFTEDENGVRTYTDKELEACMVYGQANDADVKYNLSSGINERYFPRQFPQIQVGIRCGGLNNPKYADYDMSAGEREAGNYEQAFNISKYAPMQYSAPVTHSVFIADYATEIPEIQEFWDVRPTGFEPALLKVLAARSDEEFEQYFNDMVQYAADHGLNEETCAIWEEYIKTNYPDDWAALEKGFAE